MAKTRVVINRTAFGANVMAGPGVTAKVTELAGRVSSRVPDTTVEAVIVPVRDGGVRVRARVELHRVGGEWVPQSKRDELVTALLSVLPQGKRLRKG